MAVRDSMLVTMPRLPSSVSISSPLDFEPVMPESDQKLEGQGSAPTTYS